VKTVTRSCAAIGKTFSIERGGMAATGALVGRKRRADAAWWLRLKRLVDQKINEIEMVATQQPLRRPHLQHRRTERGRAKG